jgi:glycosyltransferase involved in cell wall biosynthesis
MEKRVALVHDYLNQNGGAEKVLEAIHGLYPTAPIYTSIYAPDLMPAEYRSWTIHTSFMQHLPLIRQHHQPYLLLYPKAFERFSFDDYDLVLSSSSAFAKGARAPRGTPHICYCHSPMRFVWDFERYAEREQMNPLARRLLPIALSRMRRWDLKSALRVDHFIANSTVVSRRIKQFWNRDSDVVYPPVDTAMIKPVPPDEVGDYYVLVSRLVPYKRFDIVIDAFNQLGLPLKVIGIGRAREDLERRAGPGIEFLGFVSDDEKHHVFSRCKAAIFPAEDDFGIAQVEVQAAGRPVIALGAGGALDTVADGVTGILFQPQTVDGVIEAVRRFESLTFSSGEISARVERFSRGRFEREIAQIVERHFADRDIRTQSIAEATFSWN